MSKEHDNLLSSTNKEDILRAEKLIQNKPELITPMTMMLLSIRLYDVGERDKSVFWFYVAKDRFITLADVLNMHHSSLSQVKHAISAFALLAGPYINSYAFCDIDEQRSLRKEAFKRVSLTPYKALFIPQLPAKNGDREENLASSMNEIKAGMKKMDEYLSIQENIDSFKQQSLGSPVQLSIDKLDIHLG